jgi:hypothetical protein
MDLRSALAAGGGAVTTVGQPSSPAALPFRARLALAAWPRAWRAEHRERIVTDLAGAGYRWGAVVDTAWRGTVRRLTRPRPPGAQRREWPALVKVSAAFVAVMAIQYGLSWLSVWMTDIGLSKEWTYRLWGHDIEAVAFGVGLGFGPVLGGIAVLCLFVSRLRASAVGVLLAAPLAFILHFGWWLALIGATPID